MPELTVPHGEPLKLSCGAEGYPPPKVTWYKDGTPLKERPEFDIRYQNGEASIEIPESGEGDAGVYSCVASNPSGQDSTSCNVSVSGWCLEFLFLGNETWHDFVLFDVVFFGKLFCLFCVPGEVCIVFMSVVLILIIERRGGTEGTRKTEGKMSGS